jgi:hypothetical protein
MVRPSSVGDGDQRSQRAPLVPAAAAAVQELMKIEIANHGRRDVGMCIHA